MRSRQARNKSPASAQPQIRGLSRTSMSYWRDHVEKVVGRGGNLSPNYSARIVHQKSRVRFPLHTPNREAAASKASQIFKFLIRNGWDATIARFKPDTLATRRPPTVGDVIRTAQKLSSARPQSIATYAKAFRKIAADIAKIEDGRKFDARSGGLNAWRESIDAIKLEALTPAKLLAWKNQRLKSTNPITKRRATTTVNSLIRNAKAHFAKKHLTFMRQELALPDSLPFEGISLEKPPSMRYQSRIDAKKILNDADEELAEARPEEFKILILALVCGLRRSEIDNLLWNSFDFDKGILRVENTHYHQLKSEDSAGEIDLDEGTVALFRGYLAKAQAEFVIESPFSPDRQSRSYRCNRSFCSLNTWLQTKGVKATKPLHELRKEIGSIIANDHGIFEASRYLRHSDIRITSAIYVDKKKRVTPGLVTATEFRG